MTTTEMLAMALITIAATLALFPMLLMMTRRRPTATSDLDSDDHRPIMGELTGPLAHQIPMSNTGRDELQRLLMAAGFYHKSALNEYLAIRTVLTLVPLFVAGAIALLVPNPVVTRVIIGGVIAALLGFSIPRVVLGLRARSRGREMARGLPLAIDLLNLCLTAGQNLPAALGQVSSELKTSNPVLSQELAIVHRQAELHSTEVALQQWADRVQVPEVSNLVLVLIQSERLGTDTAATLSEMATNFRSNARQRAETQANRASFWMLFPSVFCFFVAAALMLVGPAYLQFFENRQDQNSLTSDSIKSGLEKANRRQTYHLRSKAKGE